MPEALLAVAHVTAAAKDLNTFNKLEYVLDHLRRGEIEKVEYESDRRTEVKFGVKIKGKWYHVHIMLEE